MSSSFIGLLRCQSHSLPVTSMTNFYTTLTTSTCMFAEKDLVTGVVTRVGTEKFDLIDNNLIGDADITEWLRLTGAYNGYGGGDPNAPVRRGDTDNLSAVFPFGRRTVDITDFANFLDGFTGAVDTWEAGNFNGDGIVDITDFATHFLLSFLITSGGRYGSGQQSIFEHGTLLLFRLNGLVLAYLCCHRTRAT